MRPELDPSAVGGQAGRDSGSGGDHRAPRPGANRHGREGDLCTGDGELPKAGKRLAQEGKGSAHW